MTADPRLLQRTTLLGTVPSPDLSPGGDPSPSLNTSADPVAPIDTVPATGAQAAGATAPTAPPAGATPPGVEVAICVNVQQADEPPPPPAAAPPPALGGQGTLRIDADNAMQIQAQIAAAASQQRMVEAVPPAPEDGVPEEAARAAPASHGSVAIEPPVAPAASSLAHATSTPPTAAPSAAPPAAAPARGRARGKLLLVALLGVGFLFAGLLFALAVGYAVYQRSVAVAVEPSPSSTLGSEATPSPVGSVAPAASAEPGSPVSPPAVASEPALAPSADSEATATPGLPNVTLTCSPECQHLDRITCDGTEVRLVDGRLRLDAGKHICVFAAPGYLPTSVAVEVADGKPNEVSVVLRRRGGNTGPARPCGTFLDPC